MARILHVVWRLDEDLGGTPAAAVNMAAAETEYNLTTSIVTTRAPLSKAQGAFVATRDDAIVSSFPRSRLSVYSYSRAFRSWLRSHIHEFDLVEIHGIFNYPALVAAAAASRASVPYLVHPHGSLDPYDLAKHRLLKQVAVGPLLVRPMLARARRVVVASDFEQERLHTYRARCRVEVIPLPYEVDLRPADPMVFRRANDLEGKMIVLYLGRIDSKKGLGNLINGVAALQCRFSELVLVLGGDDRSNYARRLQTSVIRRGLQSRVRFLGHLGTVAKREALAAADIFALVSENENYGLVIVEAAAWGVPVLTTTQVGVGSYFAKSDAAVIVEPNYHAVVTGLAHLLSDQNLRRRLSLAGRGVAGGVLSWDACAKAQQALRLAALRERVT